MNSELRPRDTQECLDKLNIRKLRCETLKLRAEAKKLHAEAQNSRPLLTIIKYSFAGLVAGISCYVLFAKVMKDLYDLNIQFRKELEAKSAASEKASEALASKQKDYQTDIASKSLKLDELEATIKATREDMRVMTLANATVNDELNDKRGLLEQMKEEVQRKILEGNKTKGQMALLVEQEMSLTQALERAEATIPKRANDTLGYIRIGQLDPRGYFISGKCAVKGNPSLESLRVGVTYKLGSDAYRVRVSLPRNDLFYHTGVTQIARLNEGDSFIITEGPTIYWRNEDRDVWVGVRKDLPKISDGAMPQQSIVGNVTTTSQPSGKVSDEKSQ